MAEDEKVSDTEDCHTNLFQTKLKVNPALFRKSGKHTKSSLKEINELKAMLCKVVATENKDFSPYATRSKTSKKRKLAASTTGITSSKVGKKSSNTRIIHLHAKEFIAFITVKTMPEIMRKLIPDDVRPAFICTSYCHNKDKYNKALKLSKKEQKVLSNLSSDGFHKCDTPLLYKLCPYFDFVTAPSKGWGTFHHKLQNVGDALEAIVKLRHEYICNSTQDFQVKFDRMVEIAKVVDKELSAAERFEDAIVSFSVDAFNNKYLHELKTALQQIRTEATNGQKGSFKDNVLKEDEPMRFDENYNPDVLHKPIVLSPDPIKIKGKETRNGFKIH